MFLKGFKNICLTFCAVSKDICPAKGGAKCARVKNIENRVSILARDNFIRR